MWAYRMTQPALSTTLPLPVLTNREVTGAGGGHPEQSPSRIWSQGAPIPSRKDSPHCLLQSHSGLLRFLFLFSFGFEMGHTEPQSSPKQELRPWGQGCVSAWVRG